MKYIKTNPVSPRTKKSWWALIMRELKNKSKDDNDPYFMQFGKTWESYDYQNLLRQIRGKNKALKRVDEFPEVRSYKWHFKHHLELLKKGVRKPSGRVQEY